MEQTDAVGGKSGGGTEWEKVKGLAKEQVCMTHRQGMACRVRRLGRDGQTEVGGGGNGDNCNSINNKTQGKKKRIQFRNEIFTDYVKTIFLTSDTKNLLFYKINNSLAEMSNFCYS